MHRIVSGRANEPPFDISSLEFYIVVMTAQFSKLEIEAEGKMIHGNKDAHTIEKPLKNGRSVPL